MTSNCCGYVARVLFCDFVFCLRFSCFGSWLFWGFLCVGKIMILRVLLGELTIFKFKLIDWSRLYVYHRVVSGMKEKVKHLSSLTGKRPTYPFTRSWVEKINQIFCNFQIPITNHSSTLLKSLPQTQYAREFRIQFIIHTIFNWAIQ